MLRVLGLGNIVELQVRLDLLTHAGASDRLVSSGTAKDFYRRRHRGNPINFAQMQDGAVRPPRGLKLGFGD
jgi:hypothetical protein